jgi:hydrogenase maturation protease HycI
MAGMKTSNSSWKEQLDQKLHLAVRTKHNSDSHDSCNRIAVVGIGSELNGDDAAGILVARELTKAAGLPADFLAIEAGSVPENASGPLRRFSPDLVILVDAADLGEEIGTIQWLVKDRIGGMSASSHTIPLSVFGGFLEAELGCKVEYLGIQPGQLEFDKGLCPEVAKSVQQIVDGMIEEFSEED